MADGTSQIDALIGELRETSRRADALVAEHAASQLPSASRRGTLERRRVYRAPQSQQSFLSAATRGSAAQSGREEAHGQRAISPELERAASEVLGLEPPSRLRLPTSGPFKPIDVNNAAAACGEFESLNQQLEEQLDSARGLDLGGAKIVSPFARKREVQRLFGVRADCRAQPAALVASGECAARECGGRLTARCARAINPDCWCPHPLASNSIGPGRDKASWRVPGHRQC